nr:efflux RND transporter periplasmic adaptor subunit [Sphingomonas crusticola]
MLTHDIHADKDAEARSARSRSVRNGSVAVVAALLVAGGAWKLTHQAPAAAAPPPANVTIASPLARDVRAWDDYVGRFAPSKTVEVRPRVSGQVVGVHFKDGDIVRQGQLLFTIDPRPFAAALAEARANGASARSTLALARADLARANRLVGDEAISAGEVDALRARVQAAQAAVAAADARTRDKALDVEFTQVRAPISGRISDRRVDAGNQVAGGEGTAGSLLTTINALDPIYFSFDGSEALFIKAQRARAAGTAASPVEIQLQDEAGYRWKGRLDFTDNGLDPRSGTIRGRAVLPNPNYFLTPGMFGNMRLASGGTQRALLVPDSAIQTDQARKTLLVVGKDGKVAVKPVQLGPVVDGLRVIASGISPTDKVIISGTQMALPGMPVDAHPGKIAPEAGADATPSAIAPAAAQATFAR